MGRRLCGLLFGVFDSAGLASQHDQKHQIVFGVFDSAVCYMFFDSAVCF